MKCPLIRTALVTAVLSTLNPPAWADTSMEERLNTLEAENQELKGTLRTTEEKVTAASEQVKKVAGGASTGSSPWAENTRTKARL